MKTLLPLIICMMLLTGCTDIRTRLLPDILAVDPEQPVKFAAHTSQESEIIPAQAESLLQMPEALKNASGAEISTGHLSMLAVSGNPVSVLETYFQAQMLTPTCTVLSVPSDACGQLAAGSLPEPEQIQSAAETGLLPSRTADAVLADVRGGSGITAVCTALDDGLTLTLCSVDQCCAVLTEDACRGLALLGRRWQSFAFAAEGITYRLQSAPVRIEVTMADTLQIALSGTIESDPPLTDAAADRLTEMLSTAVYETAIRCGADLLFLREYAIRSGVTEARSCSQAQWRDMLRHAECSISLHQQNISKHENSVC
ncbi:MAG: hypothetical protein J6Z40_11185 [Oscillospiraceae bacterium]|nr:hypothetical protein [Oscillospiraceae bacterium]